MQLLPVLHWGVGLLVVGLLALPLTARLLDPLETRGAGFSFVVGTAVVTLVAFWTGQVAFGPSAAAFGVGALAALSALAVRTGVSPPWRRFAESAFVFAAAFVLAVVVSVDSPGLEVWAEGFLNFGTVKSLFRASALPPADFWFAGAPMQYYFGGHLTAVLWAFLTDTPARYVPTLAVPTFYAMVVAGGYDLGRSLGAARGIHSRLSGAFVAVFLGIGGNLYEPLGLVLGSLPASVDRAVLSALSLPANAFAGSFSTFDATHFASFPTDVPLYSVLVGSLHAHVMSQPYTLLVAAVLFAYYQTSAGDRGARVGRLAAVVPLAGVVAVTNVWSLPTALGLVALAVAFSPEHPAGLLPDGSSRLERVHGALRNEGGRYTIALGVAAVVGALGVLVVAPFVFGTDTTRPLAFLPERSDVSLYLLEYGAFLLAFALYLGPRLRRHTPTLAPVVVGAILVALAVALEFVALAFVAPVLLAAWWLLRRTRSVGYETVLVLAGAGLVLLVEVAYVNGGAAPGRYNTIYKIHSQVWLLWSVAAGTALASVVAAWLPTDSFTTPAVDRDAARAVVAVALVLATSVYGALALSAVATEDRSVVEGPTLDSTAFVGVLHPDHDAAIEWLDARAGQPHIVAAAPTERAMFGFRASPASSLTGLPTIAGWTHAADYHSEAAYNRRAADVRAIFEGDAATRAALLERYDVQYVYLGPYERERYDVRPFEREHGFRPVEFGSVTVYVVNQTALPDS
ncbi:DUF2298 domain-containing protein [Halobacterium zhouii]|uniref:DUF2298 domain-containing protein n=1 Tax=Halobacterium zhouii TaxID=2902624 RepID=UPI001E4D4118|nr:DUF2298 domain-containing protein [Halobacterium zhouii]